MLPEYMGNIQNQIRSVDVNFNEIWRYGGYMIGLSAAVVCLAFIQFYSASTVSAYVGQKLRTEMFKKVNSISLSDYNQFGTATLITRTTNDVTQIEMLIGMGLHLLIKAPITAIWAVTKILNKNLTWSSLTAIAVVVLLSVIGVLIAIVMPKFKIVQKLTDKLNGVTRENLTGIRVVRAFNAEEYQENKFDDSFIQLFLLQHL